MALSRQYITREEQEQRQSTGMSGMPVDDGPGLGRYGLGMGIDVTGGVASRRWCRTSTIYVWAVLPSIKFCWRNAIELCCTEGHR